MHVINTFVVQGKKAIIQNSAKIAAKDTQTSDGQNDGALSKEVEKDLILCVVVTLHVLYNDGYNANTDLIRDVFNEAIKATNPSFIIDDEFEREFIAFIQKVLIKINKHYIRKRIISDIAKGTDKDRPIKESDKQLLLDLLDQKEVKFEKFGKFGSIGPAIICAAWIINFIKPCSWLHSEESITSTCGTVIEYIKTITTKDVADDIDKYVRPVLGVIYDAGNFHFRELRDKIAGSKNSSEPSRDDTDAFSRAYAVLTQSLLANEQHREAQRATVEDHHDVLHKHNEKLIKKHLLIMRSVLIMAVSVVVLGVFYFRFLLDEAKDEYYDRKHEEIKKAQVQQTLDLFNSMWAWQRSIKDSDVIYEVFRGRRSARADSCVREAIAGKTDTNCRTWDDSLSKFFEERRADIMSNININTYMNYMEVWKMYDESDQIDAHTAANNLPFFELKNDKLRYLYVRHKRKAVDSASKESNKRCECGKIFDGYDIIFNKYLRNPIISTEPFFHGRERG